MLVAVPWWVNEKWKLFGPQDPSVARVKQVDGPAVVVLIVKLPPLSALIGKFIRGAEETDLISCSLS